MSTPERKRRADIQAQLFRSLEWLAWLATALAALAAWVLPLTAADRESSRLLSVVTVVYLLLFFRWVVPRYRSQPRVPVYASAGSIFIIAWASTVLGPYGIHADLFFLVVVALIATTVSRSAALSLAVLVAGADAAVTLMMVGLSPATIVQVSFRALVYIFTAYMVGTASAVLQQRAERISRRNKELAFLLEASSITSSSLNLHAILSALAEKTAVGLPATFCRICLLDRSREALITGGVHATRPRRLAHGDWPGMAAGGCAPLTFSR